MTVERSDLGARGVQPSGAARLKGSRSFCGVYSRFFCGLYSLGMLEASDAL